MKKYPIGSINWFDISVPDAEGLRDFYKEVVGWTDEALDMGDRKDYVMSSPETKEPVSGICHNMGENADLPPQWIMYVIVADIQKSIEACEKRDGKTLTKVKDAGEGLFCIIQDPAGAVCALYQNK